MHMNNLNIETVQSQLVIDSRLISKELGIDHKNFLETIRRHKETIETAFGELRRETYIAETPTGGNRHYFLHYWLNEEQATFVMSLSRNTEQVVQCKVNLVKAFSEAKKQLENKKQPKEFNNVYINRLCFSADKIKIPANHWIIFDECGKLMRFLERNVEVNKFDLVDGSVGKCWSNYRKQQAEKGADWLHDRAIYEHPFPDKRGSKECWAYHVNELARFRVWFQGEYIPFHLWSYLKGKYPVDTVRQLEASHHQLVLT